MGRTLGHQGARHSSTNRMHQYSLLYILLLCISNAAKINFPCPQYDRVLIFLSPVYFITVEDHIRSRVPAASGWSWTSMHQRCVRCPARGAQCEVPSACCPVRLPSVGCPVPSQGSLLDPRSRAQKGRLVRKARPSQAAGLPHFARVRMGHFPFFFLLQDFVMPSSPLWMLFPLLKILEEKGQGPLSRDGGLSFHPPARTVSALEMLPAPDIEQILETLPLFGDRPKNNGGQRDGWSAATWT